MLDHEVSTLRLRSGRRERRIFGETRRGVTRTRRGVTRKGLTPADWPLTANPAPGRSTGTRPPVDAAVSVGGSKFYQYQYMM